MKAEDYTLSSAEHARQFEEIRRGAFIGLAPETRPRAVFTGGQPGSGKSMIAAQAMKELGYNAVRIDADELRSYHKDYFSLQAAGVKNAPDLVHADAAKWAALLTQSAMDQHYNLVIGGTMRDPRAVATVATHLREAGYDVEGRVMAVNELISTLHIHKRYELQRQAQGVGRLATKEQHARAFAALPAGLEHIERHTAFSKLTLFNRDGAAIYRNERDGDRLVDIAAARQALEIERNREMTNDEKRDLAAGWGGVIKEMKNRAAPGEELDAVTTLAKEEIRKSALHGKGWGYEKLFAPAEQMRMQPRLIGKFAGLVAIQENAKRQQLDDVQKAIAAMGNKLAMRQEKDVSADAAKSRFRVESGTISAKRREDTEKDR